MVMHVWESCRQTSINCGDPFVKIEEIPPMLTIVTRLQGGMKEALSVLPAQHPLRSPGKPSSMGTC
eukprot:1563060-Amphidinium_carterae.1